MLNKFHQKESNGISRKWKLLLIDWYFLVLFLEKLSERGKFHWKISREFSFHSLEFNLILSQHYSYSQCSSIFIYLPKKFPLKICHIMKKIAALTLIAHGEYWLNITQIKINIRGILLMPWKVHPYFCVWSFDKYHHFLIRFKS